MTPGEKIALIRQHLQLTQKEMAALLSKKTKMKVTRDSVAKWENNSNQFGWAAALAYSSLGAVSLDELIRKDYRLQVKNNRVIAVKK